MRVARQDRINLLLGRSQKNILKLLDTLQRTGYSFTQKQPLV